MNNLQNFTSRLLLLLFTAVYIGSCSIFDSQDSKGNDRLEIINDDATLESRYTETDQEIIIDESQGDNPPSKAKPHSFSLRLVSELEPPIIKGEQVQATMVHMNNLIFRAVVSYNMIGSDYLGAVDVAQATGIGGNIRIRSSIHFFDADINAVYADFRGIWTAIATSNTDLITEGNRSALQFYRFRGFDLENKKSASTPVPSFAANSITQHDGRVYATSGNTGGLSVYDIGLSQELAYIELEDARWVDANDDYVVVLRGDTDGDQNGSVVLIDPDTFDIIDEYDVKGAYTPEAKNTVEVTNHLAFVAAGKEGTQIMDLTTGNILATIPIPDPASLGLSPDVVTTNAVSADDDKIFISNGEAGVYVAETDQDISDYNPGEAMDVTLLGKLQFDDLESVNHVAYRWRLLVIAAGRGGVKTVRLNN